MIRRVPWLIAAWFALHAQQSFEAASVLPSKGGTPWSYTGGPGTNDPGQVTCKNVTLEDLILRAYDVQPYQLKNAPSWFDSERYTIVAKVAPGASKADAREMMQTLLAERFKLAIRRETQEGRCYSLAIEKGGPRLKAGTEGESMERATILPDGSGGVTVPDNALGRPVKVAGNRLVALTGGGMVMILGNSQPISALARILSGLMNGPVRDDTELSGVYDFSLDFAPPPGTSGPLPGPTGDLLPGSTPLEPPLSIFQALRDTLGLRLQMTRGPVEYLVVEHAERIPTAN
jgi:uncharacterized protein (TIGR03435 family)